MRPAKIQISLRIRAVRSEASLVAVWIAKDAEFLHTDNEESEQIAWMRRLIRIFIVRTRLKVRFLTLRLICKANSLKVTKVFFFFFYTVYYYYYYYYPPPFSLSLSLSLSLSVSLSLSLSTKANKFNTTTTTTLLLLLVVLLLLLLLLLLLQL